MNSHAIHNIYADYVNPGFAELLSELDYGRNFVSARGSRLYDNAGNEYTDFLAGFGVHNIGHNHPRIVEALQNALGSESPSMLNIDAPQCQAELAQRINKLTHPDLCRAFFANSGSEAVEMAIKTARAATGRAGIVSCRGAYHGLTTGALALTDAPQWQKYFAPLIGSVEFVPFGDAQALRQVCERVRPAAFIVEPIQGEGGMNVPHADYLAMAREVCQSFGVVLIIDEIQTGLARTGQMFATPFERAVPDVLLVGKALSGGIVPIALGLVGTKTWDKAFGGPERCNLNASTFAGGRLACAAASATLDIIEEENLAARTAELGAITIELLKPLAQRHRAICAIRGRGLMIGIELESASGFAMRLVPEWARDGLQANVICALLLRDHGIIAQPCSLRQNVIRVEPPLTISEGEIRQFISALDAVLALCPTPLSALKMAGRKRVLGGALR